MTIKIQAPARSDGYRPIAESMWRFGAFGAHPSESEIRYVLSAARRLDVAHAQFERVRERLASIGNNAGSIEWRRRLFALVGAAEVAMIALNRAVDMAARLGKELGIAQQLPGFVASKRRHVRELRGAYEHIDERALGRIWRNGQLVPDAAANAVFEFGTLIVDGHFRYGRWSLGVHEEATRLMVETRDYLVRVWGELNTRAAGLAESAIRRPWWRRGRWR